MTAGSGAIPASDSGLVRAWLEEAAACLVDSSRLLPPPPRLDLQPTYEAILSSRQQIEQWRHDLIKSIQMQSLQTVGSVLAHDLYNLSLRLALLSQNLERFYGDPPFLQSAKRVLDDTVERMRDLVDSFRERQENVIIKIPTDVNDVLEAVMRQMRIDQLPGIQLVEGYAARKRIWADPFFLANAFRVLVENAVEAMPSGGQLAVHTMSDQDSNCGVQVELRDTGVGMTPEFVDRELFAPFRSGKGRGLGLGMYICRQIIHLHEGEIRVSSEPGRGTCFRLEFPPGPEE
jgi:signal transduction histidine kinase